jgi:hypothetical protein
MTYAAKTTVVSCLLTWLLHKRAVSSGAVRTIR